VGSFVIRCRPGISRNEEVKGKPEDFADQLDLVGCFDAAATVLGMQELVGEEKDSGSRHAGPSESSALAR
jgi:hypothetical protein